MTISNEKLTDILMYLIDSFISLHLRAKNLNENDKYKFLYENYRQILIDEFEFRIKNHPIYLNSLKNRESGPYSDDAFNTNNPLSLLNLD